VTSLEKAVAELVRGHVDPGDGHLGRAVIAMRVADAAERLARVEVERARLAGATWREVGDAFGTNRQAAHERFSDGADGRHSRAFRSSRQSRSDSSG
jgi:hypothetical protein